MTTKERRCPECGGIVKPGHTELVYELQEIKFTVSNVRVNICEKCGQAFVPGPVASDVNRLVNRVTEDLNSFIKSQPLATTGRKRKKVAIAV